MLAPTDGARTSHRGRRLLLLTVLAIAYVAAGRLGLLLAFVNENTSPVWPPTGLAIAALLLIGHRAWPAIAAGAFIVNLTTSGVVWSSAVIAGGNTVEAIAGAYLTRRFARGLQAFDSTATILRFVPIAAGAATIAATLGAAALLMAGLAPPQDVLLVWFTWWVGDWAGALVVTPLIVLASRPRTYAWTPRRLVELALLAAALVTVSRLVFGPSPVGEDSSPLHFIIVPFLLWAAFRFSARESAAASAAIVVIAVSGTLHGHGPFVRSSPNESLLLLQAFIGVTATMMLSVAAEVSARRGVERELRTLNAELEQRVATRTEEIARAHERLMEAQGVAHVGSWEWDIPSNRVWWSDELYRMYGVTPGTPIGYEAFLGRVHEDDRVRVDALVRKAMTDRQPFTFEHRIATPNGIRTLYAAGHVVAGPSGEPVRMVGIGHDITERKRAEEERAQLIQAQAAREEAEESSRAKDQFLAILSHELRTPLNVALGWSHTLRTVRREDVQFPRAVDAIYRNLLIQARLVSDINDVSRIARGLLTIDTVGTDIAAVIKDAVTMVGETAHTRRVTIDVQMPPTPLPIVGDPKRLQQVFWNVLSNGIRFGPEGGCVRVRADGGGDTVRVTIEDDGPGIDPTFLPHVFEPFRQADSSPTRQHDGLGLGLAIARHIVELHGGSISAANGSRGGATFTIELPVAAVQVDLKLQSGREVSN